MDLEFGESSDDSDFNIDDIHQGSDDDDDSSVTDDENGKLKICLNGVKVQVFRLLWFRVVKVQVFLTTFVRMVKVQVF